MKQMESYIDGNTVVIDGKSYVPLSVCMDALEWISYDVRAETLSGINNGKIAAENEPEIETWRDDFDLYISVVESAKERLIEDIKYRGLFLKYNPRCDYKLTVEKTVEMFWGTEQGWLYCKKKRKGKKLDMLSALKKNLERNRVYINNKEAYVKDRISEIDKKMSKGIFE